MDKAQMRQQVRTHLRAMSKAEYEEQSAIICEKLFRNPFVQKGKTIAVTIPNFPEVNIMPFIEQLWAAGKIVCIPKCNAKTKEMEFYAFKSFQQTEIVYKDLREPIISETKLVQSNEIDVCIVPGIVFDLFGYRIGFGGGYYDRYLQHFFNTTIAVAFQEQVVHVVPTNEFDLPIQYLITNKINYDFTEEGQNENEKYD